MLAPNTSTENRLAEIRKVNEGIQSTITYAIRSAGHKDLIWLWENDRPQKPLDLELFPPDKRDQVRDFVLPSKAWVALEEGLGTAAGRCLLDHLECVASADYTGERLLYETRCTIDTLVSSCWALDQLAKREPLPNGSAFESMPLYWRREHQELNQVIRWAAGRLDLESHLELVTIACHLRAQCCPRSDLYLPWVDLPKELEMEQQSTRRLQAEKEKPVLNESWDD